MTKKTQKSNRKINRLSEQTFSRRRYTDNQQVQAKKKKKSILLIIRETQTKTLRTSWWLSGKESTCQSGDMGLTPGLGRSHMPWTTKPMHHSY